MSDYYTQKLADVKEAHAFATAALQESEAAQNDSRIQGWIEERKRLAGIAADILQKRRLC
jgi:hypothetical protein